MDKIHWLNVYLKLREIDIRFVRAGKVEIAKEA